MFRARSSAVASGRACWIRSWVRRSRDAATIFIAFVICCVDFTARMRRRISNSDGIYPLRRRRLVRGGGCLPELLERAVEPPLAGVFAPLLLPELRQQPPLTPAPTLVLPPPPRPPPPPPPPPSTPVHT